MNRLVEFPLEGGGSAVVEVAESELPEGPVRAARPGEIAAKATQIFEAALEKVRPAAEGIIANLRSISVPPAEIEVEFSIKLSAGTRGLHRFGWWRGPLPGPLKVAARIENGHRTPVSS